MDPHTWPCKSRTTSTNIHSATMWGYGILSRRPAWGDERWGKVARESQGYPCCQHDMMMMMTYARGFLLCFFGFLNSLCGIFSAILNPLFISDVGCPLWFRVVCRWVFSGFYPWLLCVYYMLECKGWIVNSFEMVAFEVEVLLSVCWFVVDIWDNLAIYVFYKDI